MTDPDPVELYPRYCFHLSPTWNAWCFFKSAEIHTLIKHPGFEGKVDRAARIASATLTLYSGEEFYFYERLPIKWVRIVGVVVAIDDYASRRAYTIDDSTGACIEVIENLKMASAATHAPAQGAAGTIAGSSLGLSKLPVPPQRISAYPTVDIGTVVDVKGKLSEFREEMQIIVHKMSTVRCTQDEVALWEKREKFRREVLDQPWVLRSREIRRAKREAEQDEERQEKKRARLRATSGKDGGGSTIAKRGQAVPKTVVDKVQKLTPLDLQEVLRSNKGQFGTLGL